MTAFGIPGRGPAAFDRVNNASCLPASEGAEHLLYPELGLDLILNPEGKEILQYVAPRDFRRLQAPLLARPQADQEERPAAP